MISGGLTGFESTPPGYPFMISEDGGIRPHSSVSVNTDSESRTTTITVPTPLAGQQSPITIEVRRNEQGQITQIVNSSTWRGFRTESGVGAVNPGGLGMNPWMPMGFGGMNSDSQFTMTTDIKIESGKCFPYRSISSNTTGNHTHRSFAHEVELCRDLENFNQRANDATNPLSQLKSCYDQYIREAQTVIDAHLSRNDSIYNPRNRQNANELYPGSFPASGGSWGTGVPGGPGGFGGGMGFGGSIDMIINNPSIEVSTKQEMLRMYCQQPLMREMVADDDLFPAPAQAAAQENGNPESRPQ